MGGFAMDNAFDNPAGELRVHRGVRSRVLGNRRDLVVWLPSGYANRRQRYPVVYFHDGQNIFDPRTAFFGHAWHAGEAAAERIRARTMEPAILVGIYNTGENRLHEYTPTRGPYGEPGPSGLQPRSRGRLRAYARFVATEVVPFIDRRYRTQPAPERRAQLGSSLGGLAALYGAIWHPRVFGGAAVLSPSVWWDGLAVIRFVGALRRKPPVRLWLDTGTREENWHNARLLRTALVARGWREEAAPSDLCYREYEGAVHHESAWAGRIGEVLSWLFPA